MVRCELFINRSFHWLKGVKVWGLLFSVVGIQEVLEEVSNLDNKDGRHDCPAEHFVGFVSLFWSYHLSWDLLRFVDTLWTNIRQVQTICRQM